MRIISLVALLGCGGSASSSNSSDLSDGAHVYATPTPGGNTFACATCHAIEEPSADGFRRPGHPIGNSTRRPSFKNGALTSFLDAVNSCRGEWMAAKAWQADSVDFVALGSFLAAQVPSGAAPAIHFEIVAPPSSLPAGNATIGHDLFNKTCVVCHGADAVGTNRAPALNTNSQAKDYVWKRIRTSGSAGSPVYQGLTGGRMPFWAADRLSDSEAGDLAAYVSLLKPAADGGGGGGGGGGTTPPPGCAKTSPKIGQVADLQTHFHRVSGSATIVDDCTIALSHFNFDGSGIDVRLYSGIGGHYEGGFSMGDDLHGKGAYTDAALNFTLPAGKTMNDLDGVSVWCVDAAVSFGDGLFHAP